LLSPYVKSQSLLIFNFNQSEKTVGMSITGTNKQFKVSIFGAVLVDL